MILSLAACTFDLEALVPYFRNSAFAKHIDVVEAGEVIDADEAVVEDHDMSLSFHSWAAGKVFLFRQIACPMRYSSTPHGWHL
jgi:hypothetical protein